MFLTVREIDSLGKILLLFFRKIDFSIDCSDLFCFYFF